MRYISASDMHSSAEENSSEAPNKKTSELPRFRASALMLLFACAISCCSAALLLYCSKSYAELIDRVVAYVDDTAITLSEFEENYEKMKKTTADIKEEDVINSMINRLLLLKEAKKMKLEALTDDELLKDYIDIKIGSSILIKEDAISLFYSEHINEFKGRDYLSVRDDIEKYLFELEINKQLKKHLEELRANAEVKIQL